MQGFSVFHDEALIPAFRAGIPVHIREYEQSGSTRDPHCEYYGIIQTGLLLGLQVIKDFAVFTLANI